MRNQWRLYPGKDPDPTSHPEGHLSLPGQRKTPTQGGRDGSPRPHPGRGDEGDPAQPSRPPPQRQTKGCTTNGAFTRVKIQTYRATGRAPLYPGKARRPSQAYRQNETANHRRQAARPPIATTQNWPLPGLTTLFCNELTICVAQLLQVNDCFCIINTLLAR